MIRILSITMYRSGSSDLIHYESYRDKQFDTNLNIQRWVKRMENEYSDMFGFPVKAYIVHRAKPEDRVDMMKLLEITSTLMGQSYKEVKGRSRKRELVDVRRVATMILMDMQYTPMDIEKALPFKNRIVYTYRIIMENRLLTEPGFEEYYSRIKDEVLKQIKKSGSMVHKSA